MRFDLVSSVFCTCGILQRWLKASNVLTEAIMGCTVCQTFKVDNFLPCCDVILTRRNVRKENSSFGLTVRELVIQHGRGRYSHRIRGRVGGRSGRLPIVFTGRKQGASLQGVGSAGRPQGPQIPTPSGKAPSPKVSSTFLGSAAWYSM